MTGQTPNGVPTLPGAAGETVPPSAAARSYPPPPVPPVYTPQPIHAAPPNPPQRSTLAVLGAIGFALLVLAIAYVWNEQQSAKGDAVAVAGLQGDVRALQQRLGQIEQKPTAAPTDLGPLDARLKALESKPAPVIPPPPDIQGAIAPLAGRVDTLANAQKSAGDALAAQQKAAIDGLAGQQKAMLDGLANQQKGTLDALAAQQKAALDALVAQQKAALEAMAGRIDALEKRSASAEQTSRTLTDRTSRAGLVQTAALLLDAGQPLGAIPGAPPAVARFATAKPPTESSLRLSFPDAAKAAEEASKPPAEGVSLANRMWQNAQSLVTVRQGDKVLVGTTAATTLAKARALLDAGDLPGTVAVIKTLDGGAAQAMAPWTDQAQALLDARAGLAAMAHS